MEFRILGPLEVSAAGRPLALGGTKQRTVLALLAVNANELVPRERLIDALWGDDPPADAEANLRVYVARLRKLFEAERNARPVIETASNGYVLRIEPETLDLARFRRLVASEEFADALELWRGPALADLTSEEWARHESGVLEELRLSALEARIDSDLAAGRHNELVPELEELVQAHPYRERLVGQLMLALYRSGRQPDALEAYSRLSNALREAFALEPTRTLRELERRILVQDPMLELRTAPRARMASTLRRPRRGTAALTVAVAGALTFGAALLTGAQQRPAAHRALLNGNSVVAIDRDSNDVIGEVPVGGRPTGIALGEGALWVGNLDDKTLLRIDPETRTVVDTIGLGSAPAAITVGGGSVWVASPEANAVLQVDPALNDVVATIELPKGLYPWWAPQLAYADGALWVSFWSALVRINPATSEPVRTRFRHVRAIASTGRALWAVLGIEWDRVQRLRAIGDAIPMRAFGPAAAIGIAATDRDVWTWSFEGTLSRIDADTSRVVFSAATRRQIRGIAPTRRAVWLLTRDGEVLRLDPITGRPLAKRRLGLYPPFYPDVIEAGDDAVWVAVLER